MNEFEDNLKISGKGDGMIIPDKLITYLVEVVTNAKCTYKVKEYGEVIAIIYPTNLNAYIYIYLISIYSYSSVVIIVHAMKKSRTCCFMHMLYVT